MGKMIQGLLGGFSGKVGPVVGCRWKNIYYIRSRAARVSNPNTERQQCQRGKFRTAVNFLKTILPFIQVGYRNYEQGKSAYNAAISYLMHHAFAGNGQEAVLDFERVRISQGSLTPASGASVGRMGGNMLVSWSNNTAEGDAAADDVAMLLVYNRTRGEAIWQLSAGSRSDGRCSLRLPLGWESDELAVYLAFCSVDGQRISNSVCLLNGRLGVLLGTEPGEWLGGFGEVDCVLYGVGRQRKANGCEMGGGQPTVRHVCSKY
ncbi:DUF6266 family protein [uncultured Bacteroides sp.]|uniref:DUF6266 family protein n=1 Tax=uncultured Bacteroides sp. TaxID=162156 RepID=UPI002613B331|nr:DUF6266 family protein [uncultured Bacteroides sp.]